MEVASGRKNLFIVLVYEFICTGVLTYVICMTAGSPVGKVGVIFTVLGLGLVSGPITGGNFNPAGTLAVYLTKQQWK
jgi:glycerol uptake facilitator-like aquaporin